MRVARSTKTRICAIKQEAGEIKAKLDTLRARLEEHPGTKRIARRLETVINKLDEWQRAA